MRSLYLLLVSFVMGYLTAVLLAILRVSKGKRREFISTEGMELTAAVLFSLFSSFWLTAIVGTAILVLIKFALPVAEELKLQSELQSAAVGERCS